MADRLNPQEARQGKKGQPVLIVLIAGMILAALAWGAAELFGEANDPEQLAIEEQAPAGAGSGGGTAEIAPPTETTPAQ